MIRCEVIHPVGSLLIQQAAHRGDEVAVSDAERSVTYEALEARTSSLASYLRRVGVGPGDRVLLFMRNSVAVVEANLAVVRAGGMAVCIGASSTAEDVAFFVEDCQPCVVITDSERVEAVLAVVGSTRGQDGVLSVIVDGPAPASAAGPVIAFARAAASPPDRDGLDQLGLDQPAWMLYTSGTTGRPKGVVLTQRSLLWVVAAAWLPFLRLSAGDVVVNPLPLSHSYPLDITLAALAVGGRTVLLERYSTPEVIAALRSSSATLLLCVPTTLTYLLSGMAEERATARPFPSLRCVVTAGAVSPSVLAERVEHELGVPLIDAYGSTEASTAIALNSPFTTRLPGSCGVPAPGWAVRIVDPATGKDVPVGAEGELIARGPGLMLGYFGRPQETAESLRDGWYWSGDLATQDANGFLRISGRVKDLIVRGGENIAPAEIEQVAMRHPAVFDCAVVGRSDPVFGEVPVLFVVGDGRHHLEPDEIRVWCSELLPKFKVPAEVRLVDVIPKTASGKVKRHALQ